MFKLDDNLLIELGLGSLPPAEKNRMLGHIYETLEMRVGMKLAQRMTNEQLDEFEAFIDRNDEAGALKWLETNFPNYKQVVAEELEALKAEIKAAAPQIVAASQQQAASVAAQAPAAPQKATYTVPQQAPLSQGSPYDAPGAPISPQAPAYQQPTVVAPAPAQDPQAFAQPTQPAFSQPQPQYPAPTMPVAPQTTSQGPQPGYPGQYGDTTTTNPSQQYPPVVQ